MILKILLIFHFFAIIENVTANICVNNNRLLLSFFLGIKSLERASSLTLPSKGVGHTLSTVQDWVCILQDQVALPCGERYLLLCQAAEQRVWVLDSQRPGAINRLWSCP